MIARRVELDVQSRGRCVLTAEASRGGGGPVLSAAAVSRSLRGPLAKRAPTLMHTHKCVLLQDSLGIATAPAHGGVPKPPAP